MPTKSLHFCNYNGCDQLTTERYCPEHTKLHEAEQKINRNTNRGTASDRGYDAQWSKARKAYLKRYPLCEQCEKDSKITPAVLVHHVKPIDEGGARLDPRNFMSCCRDCHERIHGRKR